MYTRVGIYDSFWTVKSVRLTRALHALSCQFYLTCTKIGTHDVAIAGINIYYRYDFTCWQPMSEVLEGVCVCVCTYTFIACCDSQSLPYPVARCLLWWAARIPTRVFDADSRLTHSVTMPGLEPGTSR